MNDTLTPRFFIKIPPENKLGKILDYNAGLQSSREKQEQVGLRHYLRLNDPKNSGSFEGAEILFLGAGGVPVVQSSSYRAAQAGPSEEYTASHHV
jgi:hypothetical protein